MTAADVSKVASLSQVRPRVIADMSPADLQAEAQHLNAAYDGVTGKELLRSMIKDEFPGKIAIVSSFGAESAVVLKMVADIDPATPVIMVDTGKLFGETLRFRDKLTRELGLMDVRTVGPDKADEERLDPKGVLWSQDTNACCGFRKVKPLNRALEGFDAWVTGRKRFQAATRAEIPSVEASTTHIKVNPLAYWGADELEAFMAEHDLPRHPLVEDGYLSIGCMPCTDRVADGEDARSGRWSGNNKVECGIHLDTFEDGGGI